MPYLSQENLDDIERQMNELVDDNNRLEEENRALKAQVQNLLTDHRYPDLKAI